jgi:anti-sigma factor RsiW
MKARASSAREIDMDSVIQQLANESILLMYLADELPEQDRTEVESMLARDPSLQQSLELLRESHAKAMDSLATLDAVDPMQIADSTTVRRTTRAIRQWQVDHAAATPPQEQVRRMRYPWWAYPAVSVAAASVLLAFLLWWSSGADAPVPSADNSQQQYQDRDTRIAGTITFAIANPEHERNIDSLADTEDELLALSRTGTSNDAGEFWVDSNQ